MSRYPKKFITYNGETKCLAHWAKRFKIRAATLGSRINKGVPFEKAVFGCDKVYTKSEPVSKMLWNDLQQTFIGESICTY